MNRPPFDSKSAINLYQIYCTILCASECMCVYLCLCVCRVDNFLFIGNNVPYLELCLCYIFGIKMMIFKIIS